MSVKELSDSQLYAMFMDKVLPIDISNKVAIEFKSRQFDIQQLDKLSLEYKKFKHGLNNDISTTEKTILLLFPFVNIIQLIIANRHLGKLEKYKIVKASNKY